MMIRHMDKSRIRNIGVKAATHGDKDCIHVGARFIDKDGQEKEYESVFVTGSAMCEHEGFRALENKVKELA
jgi:hypothetical protein